MFINSLRLQDYTKDRALNIHVNASWVTISNGPDVLFSREPQNDNWYDEDHTAIVNALSQLEAALLKAAK